VAVSSTTLVWDPVDTGEEGDAGGDKSSSSGISGLFWVDFDESRRNDDWRRANLGFGAESEGVGA
jgi:hypothetical protein